MVEANQTIQGSNLQEEGANPKANLAHSLWTNRTSDQVIHVVFPSSSSALRKRWSAKGSEMRIPLIGYKPHVSSMQENGKGNALW